MENNIIINGIYRHFKGNLYQVILVAQDSETNEKRVIYRNVNGISCFYDRPLNIFLELIPKNKQNENITNQKYRFELITNF